MSIETKVSRGLNLDKILKDFANVKTRNVSFSKQKQHLYSRLNSLSAPMWLVRFPAIVLVGADLSVSFGVVIIVQHYNTTLHCSFSVMSCYSHAFSFVDIL